jgi:hypothetical protein
MPAVNQCEFHNDGLKRTIYGGDYFKECQFVMRNRFVLKCHLNVIRNKMNTQKPTSILHVTVDKNRFYLSSSLILKDFPIVCIYGKFRGHQYSVLFQYVVQFVELCHNVEQSLLPVILGSKPDHNFARWLDRQITFG